MNVLALWVYRVCAVWSVFLMAVFGFRLMWWHFIAAAGISFFCDWRISALHKQVEGVEPQ